MHVSKIENMTVTGAVHTHHFNYVFKILPVAEWFYPQLADRLVVYQKKELHCTPKPILKTTEKPRQSHRVQFSYLYRFPSIPLPSPMSLPTTPILGFISMLMIPNYMYT